MGTIAIFSLSHKNLFRNRTKKIDSSTLKSYFAKMISEQRLKIKREYEEKEQKHKFMSVIYTTLFSPISIIMDNDSFKVQQVSVQIGRKKFGRLFSLILVYEKLKRTL